MDDLKKGVRLALLMVPGEFKYERCRRLGISPTIYSQWQHSVTEPSHESLVRLADAAGVSVEWIRSGGQDETEQDGAE